MSIFVRNYSISMMLAVQPTVDFINIPHNLTSLTGFIYGSELGLEGSLSYIIGRSRVEDYGTF